MATSRKRKVEGDVVLIGVPEGACGCGCGLEVAKGSTYRQGHDAKLKGVLGRAHKLGQSVAFVTGDARTESSAEQALVARNWPVPKRPEPKAPKPKAEAKPRAHKPRTPKAAPEATRSEAVAVA